MVGKGPLSDEHKAKLSAALKGRVITPEWREKIRMANAGKPKPESFKQQVSQTMKGRAPANIGMIAGHNKGQGQWLTCAGCGVQFQARPELSHAKTKYCTVECFRKFHVPGGKGKKRPSHAGQLHHNWQGGITDANHAIRTSLEMKLWRENVFKRDGYTCQHCGKHGGRLHAHHIKLFSQHSELRFETSNGLTLCIPCHRRPGLHLLKAE